MTTEDPTAVDERYAQFWNQFRLSRLSWVNALLKRPRLIYPIFFVTYAAFLLGMIVDSDAYESVIWAQPETLRPWIGDVFIGFAEVHLIALAILPVARAFIHWASIIPEVFEWLHKPTQRIKSNHDHLDPKYLSYLHDYQQRLHLKTPSTILSLSIIFIFVVFLLGLGFSLVETFQYTFSELWASALLLFALFWGYFLGLMIWPVIVTMQFIQGLSKHFQVIIQPSHPDKCGGLKPLGDFCFAMSMPVIIGGLVLSLVGVVGLILSVSAAGPNLYEYFDVCRSSSPCVFDPFFAFLALVLLVFLITPLIFATFFVPLWNIHRVMVTSKREAEDEFANQVAGYEGQIRSHIGTDEGIDLAKIARDKLEIIQAINPNNTGYPVWPFKATIVITIFSPQILAIAGFTLSIYQVFFKQ